MKNKKLTGLSTIVISILILLLPLAVSASSITYTYTGEGTGSLAGESFVNTPFIITAQADTNDIGTWWGSGLQNTHISATVSLEGFGLFSFASATHTWIENDCCLGFGYNLGANLITFSNPAIMSVGYDLSTAFSPVLDMGASTQGQFINVATSGGFLTIDHLNGVTFEASVTTIPEPEIYIMLLAGLGLLSLIARRWKESAV